MGLERNCRRISQPVADLVFGEVTVLRVWNDTHWEHGMHLHGHHFWVDSMEFGDKALPML